jgi:uncharacterized protein (DUF1330 family)
MAAYVLIDRLVVTDPEALRAYHDLAPPTVMRHRGQYVLPHAIQIEALEGNWTPQRIVLIAFEDAERARQWWDSSEYAQARMIHHEATISNVILLDGATG